MRRSFQIALLLVAAMILTGGAEAQMPRTLLIQGRLLDDLGDPLMGMESLTAAFYTSATTFPFAEETSDVTFDDNGVFAMEITTLQATDPLWFVNPVWVGLTVDKAGGGEELAPQIRLHASPMAIRAVLAEDVSPTENTYWNNKRITGLAAPVSGNDAVTLSYLTGEIATHAGDASAHHTRYTDGEAVTAMGAKDDANPLHHDRLTPTDVALALATPRGIPRQNSIQSLGIDNEFDLAISADGFPLLAHRGTLARLYVRHCNDADCTSPSSHLVVASAIEEPAIAIGTDGFPIIAFFDNGNDQVKIVHCTSVDCSTDDGVTVLDTVGTSYGHPSIAIGTDGLPVVAYTDSTSSDLMFVHCTNTACSSFDSPVILDAEIGASQGHPSLVIGSDGFPLVAYYDGDVVGLFVVHCTSVDCSTSDTPTSLKIGSISGGVSMALGRGGLPVIARKIASGIEVIQCTSTDCSTTGTPTILDASGLDPDLEVGDDGLPLVAFYDPGNDDLMVIHCSNDDCSIFEPPQAAATTNDTGALPKIAIRPGGLPAIAHYDVTGDDVDLLLCGNLGCRPGFRTGP